MSEGARKLRGPMTRSLRLPRSGAFRIACASWSGCWAARRWKSRSSRTLSNWRGQKTDLAVALAGSGRYPLKAISRTLPAARSIETPYIVLLPDDDILFPHAITAALTHLKQNPMHVAAHCHSLRFGLGRGDFDIYQANILSGRTTMTIRWRATRS
jgi:hypothetical protein